jgi:hypothetical protein
VSHITNTFSILIAAAALFLCDRGRVVIVAPARPADPEQHPMGRPL